MIRLLATGLVMAVGFFVLMIPVGLVSDALTGDDGALVTGGDVVRAVIFGVLWTLWTAYVERRRSRRDRRPVHP